MAKAFTSIAPRRNRILTDLIHRERITGTTGKGQQTAVAIFHPEHKMIRFTPDVENSERTDASYHLPAFYELWARFGPERDRDFWKSAAAVSRDYFYRAAHPTTGLTPEYGNFDGTPWVASWNQRSGDFVADAWRTAMNWSMDWAWWAADPRQQELSDRIQSFLFRKASRIIPAGLRWMANRWGRVVRWDSSR
jgi:oligosaccharide reducing-end xylanase